MTALHTRELPAEEWSRLAGTELGSVCAALPNGTRVIVVEDATGAVVGCWAALLCVHAEGIWIAEGHRGKTAVARRLWRGMRQVLGSWGVSQVLTAATDPQMLALLDTHGERLPGTHFRLEVKG